MWLIRKLYDCPDTQLIILSREDTEGTEQGPKIIDLTKDYV